MWIFGAGRISRAKAKDSVVGSSVPYLFYTSQTGTARPASHSKLLQPALATLQTETATALRYLRDSETTLRLSPLCPVQLRGCGRTGAAAACGGR